MREKSRLFFSASEITLIRKDIIDIWKTRGVGPMLLVIPIVLVVLIPIIYLVAVCLIPLKSEVTLLPKVQQVLSILPANVEQVLVHQSLIPQSIQSILSLDMTKLNERQALFHVFSSLIAPLFFLVVPIVCSVASASCAFVSEREEGTLETLMLSSMRIKRIYRTKISACVLLSLVISYISFILFAITIGVGDIILAAPVFFNFEWLMIILFVTPAISLFSVAFISYIMPHVETVGESMQLIGYLILPFAAIFIFQFSGIFHINAPFLAFLALMLIILGVTLYNVAIKRFADPEKTLSRLYSNDEQSTS